MLRIIKLTIVFLLLASVSSSDNNLRLELIPGLEGRIRIQWFIGYEEYQESKLIINSSIQTNEINIYESQGFITGCCFYEEVEVTLSVLHNGIEKTISDRATPSASDLDFIEPIVTPTTTTTIPPSTTTTLFSEDELIISDGLTSDANQGSESEETLNVEFLQISNLLNYELENNYLNQFNSFDYNEFTNRDRINQTSIYSFIILLLFYLAIATQEWFASKNDEYDVFPKISRQAVKRSNKFLLFLAVLLTAFVIAVVEEGFQFQLTLNNLILLIVTTVVFISITALLDGSELFIEKYFYNSTYFFQFSKKVLFFAFISVLMFYYFEFPFGFVYGFVISTRILTNRGQVPIAPKVYALIIFLTVVFLAYITTSNQFVTSSPFLSSLVSFFVLVGIESVLFRLIPGGGNQFQEILNSSKGIFKILPTAVFLLTLWLFVHCLVTPPSSEVKTLLEEFSTDNIFGSLYFQAIISYIFIMFTSGLFLVAYGTKVSNNFLFQRFSENR